MTLFINCCPRSDSRTKRIADALLAKLGDFEEISLYETELLPLDEARLQVRGNLLSEGNLNAPEFTLARRFANAERIVIAAPFWDLSFPSKLKLFFENIYIVGIVSRYNEKGLPEGLCRGRELFYVTTAGGPFDGRFGFDYVKALATDYFGIPEVKLVKAEMLDVDGFDAEKIVKETIEKITV